jgi:hypothetical protein
VPPSQARAGATITVATSATVARPAAVAEDVVMQLPYYAVSLIPQLMQVL